MTKSSLDLSRFKMTRFWIATSATLLVAVAGLIACLTPTTPASPDSHSIILPEANKPWWKRPYKNTVSDVDSMHCMGGPWNQCDSK
jgi:hypothetical protein